MVTNFIYQAINDKDITIYGTGDQTRSFSFIEDTLDGLLRVINYEESDVFNIGSENEITIKFLAETIVTLTNSNSKIIFEDLPENDPKQRKPDLTKAKKLLGYNPNHTLEEGLKITIDWIKKTYK